MTQPLFRIRSETPADHDAIKRLHELAFGPGRFARTAFRIREGVDCDPELSLTACRDGRLFGTVRFIRITVGRTGEGLLLGPIAVHPVVRGRGCGLALLRASLARAKGVTSMIGLQARGAPAILHLKELISQGYVGEVLACNMTMFLPGLLQRGINTPWMADREKAQIPSPSPPVTPSTLFVSASASSERFRPRWPRKWRNGKRRSPATRCR